MLPGLNAAAVGLISGAVVLLTFQIHGSSPFPTFSMCIGEMPPALLHSVDPAKSDIKIHLPASL